MKLVETSAELLPWEPGVEGVYKMIERAGRTCYKSEDKITEDSAKPFVLRMAGSKHTAMLEHGTVYLKYPQTEDYVKYHENPYSRLKMTEDGDFAVTTNLRVIMENGWENDLQYLCDPTEYHEMRYTFKMTTSIGVTRELNRHRVNSIAEQSTRYCNYAKDKFGKEITICKPYWLDDDREFKTSEAYNNAYELFYSACEEAEGYYMILIDEGFSPQQAREVLPLCTASEIVHTAFASNWARFFSLRLFESTGKVHPNMKKLTQLMQEECIKHGIWEDINKYITNE